VIALYLFCLAAGGAMLLFSVLGHDSDDDHFDHEHSEGLSEWFSLRTLTYFFAFFGACGATLTYFNAAGPAMTAGLAAFTGLVAGGMAKIIIGAARNENAAGGGTVRTGELVGQTAAVLVSFSGTENGRIKMLSTIAHTEMMCVGDGGVFAEGDVVRITDVRNDVARVSKVN
jgi:hypothetical protein